MTAADYLKQALTEAIEKEKTAQVLIQKAKQEIDSITGDLLGIGLLIGPNPNGLRSALQETHFSRNELDAAQASLANLAEELIQYRNRL